MSEIDPARLEAVGTPANLVEARPKLHAAVESADGVSPGQPEATVKAEAEAVAALRRELGLGPEDASTLRSLLAAGLTEDQIIELADALLLATLEDIDLALSLFRAFAARGGLLTVPGVRPRIDGRSVALLGEVAGQVARELAFRLPMDQSVELAAVTAWPLSFARPDEIVATPTAMLEMLLSNAPEARTRAVGVSLAAPGWFAEHMAFEEQERPLERARALVDGLFGDVPDLERGFAEAAALAAEHRFGEDSARALLSGYLNSVGPAAGLVLVLAMAEHPVDDESPDDTLSALADQLEHIESQLAYSERVMGIPEISLPHRSLVSSHAAEQLVAAGNTQLFLVMLRLLSRNSRLSKMQMIRRLARLPRGLAASGDEEALAHWVSTGRQS
ncbi:MAG: hypothetical protein AAFU77_07260 [Myxococcota bacterium]